MTFITLGKKKKKFVSRTFAKIAKCYSLFFFFFLENEQCKMWEFFFIVFFAHFGQLFSFFSWQL